MLRKTNWIWQLIQNTKSYVVSDVCNYSNTLWLEGRIRLFGYYTISLSSLGRLIWRYWAYKKLVRYISSSVCLRLSQSSEYLFMQYIGLRVSSLPISLVMIVRIYALYYIIIIKSDVWIIGYCLGLCHETMVWAVCRFNLCSSAIIRDGVIRAQTYPQNYFLCKGVHNREKRKFFRWIETLKSKFTYIILRIIFFRIEKEIMRTICASKDVFD